MFSSIVRSLSLVVLSLVSLSSTVSASEVIMLSSAPVPAERCANGQSMTLCYASGKIVRFSPPVRYGDNSFYAEREQDLTPILAGMYKCYFDAGNGYSGMGTLVTNGNDEHCDGTNVIESEQLARD